MDTPLVPSNGYCLATVRYFAAMVHVKVGQVSDTKAAGTCLDAITYLPPEMGLAVLERLDVPSLCRAAQTCSSWSEFISDTDWLWKKVCQNCQDIDPKLVEMDRAEGLPWRAAVMRNYGAAGIQRQWRLGFFSRPSSYEDIPDRCMCEMDADTWGQILQLELDR
ncbi:F-box-like [Branchiostoma belcheri]|nr:F-box-like [Branchiostoma belcheri]